MKAKMEINEEELLSIVSDWLEDRGYKSTDTKLVYRQATANRPREIVALVEYEPNI